MTPPPSGSATWRPSKVARPATVSMSISKVCTSRDSRAAATAARRVPPTSGGRNSSGRRPRKSSDVTIASKPRADVVVDHQAVGVEPEVEVGQGVQHAVQLVDDRRVQRLGALLRRDVGDGDDGAGGAPRPSRGSGRAATSSQIGSPRSIARRSDDHRRHAASGGERVERRCEPGRRRPSSKNGAAGSQARSTTDRPTISSRPRPVISVIARLQSTIVPRASQTSTPLAMRSAYRSASAPGASGPRDRPLCVIPSSGDAATPAGLPATDHTSADRTGSLKATTAARQRASRYDGHARHGARRRRGGSATVEKVVSEGGLEPP